MQAYATQQDIIDLHGQRAVDIAADRDGDGQVDPQAVDRALASATAIIKGYELRRTTPLVDEQAEADMRRYWAIDIGLYLLSMGAANSDEYRTRRDDAVRLAKDFYQPSVNGDQHGGDRETSSGATSSANSRLFTRESMRHL